MVSEPISATFHEREDPPPLHTQHAEKIQEQDEANPDFPSSTSQDGATTVHNDGRLNEHVSLDAVTQRTNRAWIPRIMA